MSVRILVRIYIRYICKNIEKIRAFTFHKCLENEIVRKNAAIQTFTTKGHKFILLINS